MEQCPRCGVESFSGDKFCGSCGYNLSVKMEMNTIVGKKTTDAKDMRINLGVIYLKQGKYDLAIQSFEKVLEEDPNNSMAQKMLVEANEGQSK